jgi:hypothetical protein
MNSTRVRYRCAAVGVEYMFIVVVAAGSLCGFISLAWLILRQVEETRERLTITSARSQTGGVDVRVQYRPDRTRVGLSARVELIEPTSGAKLLAGVRQERGDRYGAYAIDEPDTAVSGSRIEVPLRHLRPDPTGVFAAIFYVEAEGGEPPRSAKVKIEIWTEAGPTRLISRAAEVHAIHW